MPFQRAILCEVRWTIPVAALGMACQPAAASKDQPEETSSNTERTTLPDAPSPPASTSPIQLATVTVVPPPHPLADLSSTDLARLLDEDRAGLGTASIGLPNRGQLFNGVRAESNDLWEVVDPDRSWATPATLAGLSRAIEAVHRQFPGTPRLHLGDLSREHGGWLRPHRSHQSGLDADVSYYYTTEQRWYLKATAENLDRARSWALVRNLVGDPTVEYVFVDVSVQRLLREHAERIGESRDWLDSVFGGMDRRTEAPIRHTWGHRTHLHVRFLDPVAQVTAQRAYPLLKARRLVR